MFNRLKELRKALNLNQTKFAAALGIGQSTLGMMEVGKREIGERHIKTICAIYNVNEQWLRTGEGPMFNENEKSLFDELSNEYKLSSTERALIESFLELSPDGRKAVAGYIKTAAKRMTAADSSKRDTLIEQQLSKLSRTIADTAPNTIPAQTK